MYTFLHVFKIEFFSNGVIYTAEVHKIPSENPLAIEYHAFHIRPEIPKAPTSFTFVYHPQEGTFDCTIFKDDVDLSQNMFTAIRKYCLQHDIQLA